MSIGFLVGLVRNAVYQVFIMTSPILGAALIIGLIVAVLILAALIYLLVRPYKESKKLGVKVKVSK